MIHGHLRLQIFIMFFSLYGILLSIEFPFWVFLLHLSHLIALGVILACIEINQINSDL